MKARLVNLTVACSTIFLTVALYSNTIYTKAFTSTKNPTITIDDLTQAGYSGITQQEFQGTKYRPPNLYFWVNNGNENDLGNLVMVFVYDNGFHYTDGLFNYGTAIHQISIIGSRAQEGKLAGDTRTAVNFAKGNFYVVVFGPDSQKVETLAAIIANKIN